MSQQILDFIHEQAQVWAADFVANRKAALDKRGIVASGSLKQSLAAEASKEVFRQAVEVYLAFEEYGRIAEMRRVTHDKWGRNAIHRLEDWVRVRGVAAFLEGYRRRRRYIPRVEARLVNSIAWGIAINRTSGKFRRRTWYNKPKTAAITQLFNQVAAGLADVVSEEITSQFTTNK